MPNHPSVAESFNNMDNIYQEQGKEEEALEMYTKSLEIRTRIFGDSHPSAAATYTNLAAFYQEQGNQIQANEMASKAHHINLNVLGAS